MDMNVPDRKITDKKTGRSDSDNLKQEFPQHPVLKKTEKQENKAFKENDNNELILIYKTPIFKYPKYDFY